MSDSLPPHRLQHARLPCPSPSCWACLNSCPLSQWCHPTVSSSVIPLSSCLQSFPASGSFLMSQLFISGGQSIGASAPVSVLLVNIQGWLPLGWTGLISLLSRGSQEFPPTPQFKSINSLALSFLYWRRKWQPTPVFLPGEPQGWGSLVGCCLWGHTESDTTGAI